MWQTACSSHIFYRNGVQKLHKMCCILINQSPEKLLCKPRQKLHEHTLLLAKHWKSSLILLTAKILWLLKSHYFSFYSIQLELLLETPMGRGEHQQKRSSQRNSEREQFLENDAVNMWQALLKIHVSVRIDETISCWCDKNVLNICLGSQNHGL